MTIAVINHSSNKISVSINHWGSSGDTSWFDLSPGSSDTWDRSDSRGFVMAVSQDGGGTFVPYLVGANDTLKAYDPSSNDDSASGVVIKDGSGDTLDPATDRYDFEQLSAAPSAQAGARRLPKEVRIDMAENPTD